MMSLLFVDFREKDTYLLDMSLLHLSGNTRITGYWQSEKYFIDYREELLKMLTPTYAVTKSFESTLLAIKRSFSVSIHVRRGDFVSLGWCLDIAYYKKAIKLMSDKIQNPVFYVFSDDNEKAKNLFEGIDARFNFVDYEAVNPTIEDFLLMKSCKHNIIANSSYSWWGAWANNNPDKIVLCPPREARDFFYPKEWIVVK